MELNYAIFRSEPITTIPDLAQIGSHNKREKKAYQSNKDIKIELSKNNIELVPLNVKYVKGFDELTKEYKKVHEERMKTNKKIPFDNKHVILEKETFDSMNNVIKESKKVMELQPKLQAIFNQVDSYANSYKSLEKENQKYKKKISKLEKENQNLEQENRSLIYRLNELFQLLRKFLRKLLQRGNDYTKEETALVVKDCYDNSEFDMGDVVRISKGTTKQDELFEYVEAPDYYKERVRDYDENEYNKDDFDLSR